MFWGSFALIFARFVFGNGTGGPVSERCRERVITPNPKLSPFRGKGLLSGLPLAFGRFGVNRIFE